MSTLGIGVASIYSYSNSMKVILASSQTKDGWLTMLTKDPHARRVAIINIAILGFILVAVLVVAASALKNPPVQSVSGASTMLSSCAQVGATFAGFLMVGLIFLIQLKSNKQWITSSGPLKLIRSLDVIFFGLATVVFSLMALIATDSLGYVASQTQIDDKTIDFVSQTAVLLRVGMVLATVGFSSLIVNYWDRMKETRLR